MIRCFNQTALPVLIGSALLAAGCASTDSEGIAGPPPANTPEGFCEASVSELTIPVGDAFSDGELLRDYYTGHTATVRDGQVTMTPGPDSEGLVLLERVQPPSRQFTWAGATVYFAVTDRFAN
ncbi:MAG TPA: hypothetical protein VLA15_07535, partial [Desulfurivibrionaceae bacterium]|nr:hypothetical protein [Desulfurivibrionaceae bacterium]